MVDADGVPLLLTAYHCCENAVRIRVLVEAHGTNYQDAKLVGANPKMDIALLRIPALDASIAARVFELEAGDSDKCHMAQRIQAVGFALGKTFNQSTVGVISGRTYTHLQIDAAINGGNSGGPVMDSNGKVIGIVLAGMDRAQNVNYMCPINESRMSAAEIIESALPRPVCINNADLNCKCLPAPKALIDMLKSPKGVLVAAIHSGTPLHRAGMREGDVLTSLAGHDIDHQGRIEVDWWVDKLPVYAILPRLSTQESTPCRFWSRKTGRVVDASVQMMAGSAAKFDKVFPEFEHLPYVSLGGIVVQHLTKNLLAHYKPLAAVMSRPTLHEHSLLIVTNVMPESPFSELHTIANGDVILTVNELPVRTLEQYRDAFHAGLNQGGVRLVVRDGNEVASSSHDLKEAQEAMRKRIPTLRLDATTPDE
jgi:S1-C subfamily serine protease